MSLSTIIFFNNNAMFLASCTNYNLLDAKYCALHMPDLLPTPTWNNLTQRGLWWRHTSSNQNAALFSRWGERRRPRVCFCACRGSSCTTWRHFETKECRDERVFFLEGPLWWNLVPLISYDKAFLCVLCVTLLSVSYILPLTWLHCLHNNTYFKV